MSDHALKYSIEQDLIPKGTKRRSGRPMDGVKFIVVHDTGNPNSTARGNVKYYIRSANEMSASAHLFVDDKQIIECVPAFHNPEKAWHVWYSSLIDNEMYGCNANDCAIGVEYCYGTNINADEAYKRYIWVVAKLCTQYTIDPSKNIVGHFFLDPTRKTDPVTGLAHSRRTYEQLLRDIREECKRFDGQTEIAVQPETKDFITVGRLNVRQDSPTTLSPVVKVLPKGTKVKIISTSDTGQAINGNSTWYQGEDGGWMWSGGLAKAT